MKKKWLVTLLVMILVVVMSVALVACKDKTPGGGTTPPGNDTEGTPPDVEKPSTEVVTKISSVIMLSKNNFSVEKKKKDVIEWFGTPSIKNGNTWIYLPDSLDRLLGKEFDYLEFTFEEYDAAYHKDPNNVKLNSYCLNRKHTFDGVALKNTGKYLKVINETQFMVRGVWESSLLIDTQYTNYKHGISYQTAYTDGSYTSSRFDPLEAIDYTTRNTEVKYSEVFDWGQTLNRSIKTYTRFPDTAAIIRDGMSIIQGKIVSYDNKDKVTEITIPLIVSEIGEAAFLGHIELTKVVIPKTVKKIGDTAFMGCAKLQTVSIFAGNTQTGEGVTEIGLNAFANCPVLKTINLPVTLKSIGERAFESCSALTEISIPRSVATIGTNTFNTSGMTIKCEISEYDKPVGWHINWAVNSPSIIWGSK